MFKTTILLILSTIYVGPAAFANESAVFAGGCFWCMQPPYEELVGKGVVKTTVGFSGGTKDKPTYEEVSQGGTGHSEVIEVEFDPKLISFSKLLDIYWINIDPLDAKGQFCDKGQQYMSAIYYQNETQKKTAEESLARINEKLKIKGEKIKTEIVKGGPFFTAEEYHQLYYKKNPIRYKFYRSNCGRDRRLKEVWGEAAKH